MTLNLDSVSSGQSELTFNLGCLEDSLLSSVCSLGILGIDIPEKELVGIFVRYLPSFQQFLKL